MTKTYISSTEVSFNVCVAGEWTHVSFVPLTLGGSYLDTSDSRLQQAIEHHRFFGTIVRLKPVAAAPPPSSADTHRREADGPKTITINSLADAKDWLADKFGISRTLLRTKEDIVAAARQQGWLISFSSQGSPRSPS